WSKPLGQWKQCCRRRAVAALTRIKRHCRKGRTDFAMASRAGRCPSAAASGARPGYIREHRFDRLPSGGELAGIARTDDEFGPECSVLEFRVGADNRVRVAVLNFTQRTADGALTIGAVHRLRQQLYARPERRDDI